MRRCTAARLVSSVMLAGLTVSLVSAIPARAAEQPQQPKGYELAKASDCFSCHAIGQEVVGPAWLKVAKTYAGQPDAALTLATKIKAGGIGHWGTIPMPAHPKLSDTDADQIARWILTLKGEIPQKAPPAFQYKTAEGKTVTVDFPVFIGKKGRKVTDGIFGGYEKYDSYCFRCHGPDAEGGEYAPDLRKSLNNGMTKKQFFIIAMEGEKDKGMPEWAGFFTAGELNEIYEYVKARAVGLVNAGRPPSKSD